MSASPSASRVLFVVDTGDGASVRYRARVPAEVLRGAGVDARLAHRDSPALGEALSWADVVVLARVHATAELATALREARRSRQGPRVLAEMDAPVFLDLDGASHGGAVEEVSWYRWTLDVADGFVGTTAALVGMAGDLTGAPGVVAPNALSPTSAALADRARRVPRVPGAFRMLVMSGSGTHDRHWQKALPAVQRFLSDDPRSLLWLVGPLDSGPGLSPLREQVRRFPFLDWTDLPYLVHQADVVLVPNSDPRYLADTKSHVKWLEAGSVGVPVVASGTEPYRAVVDHGRSGWLAADDDGWLGALGEAADRHRAVGEQAHGRVMEAAGPRALLHAWRRALGLPRRDAPFPDPAALPSVPADPVSAGLGPTGRRRPRPTWRHLLGAWRNPST